MCFWTLLFMSFSPTSRWFVFGPHCSYYFLRRVRENVMELIVRIQISETGRRKEHGASCPKKIRRSQKGGEMIIYHKNSFGPLVKKPLTLSNSKKLLHFCDGLVCRGLVSLSRGAEEASQLVGLEWQKGHPSTNSYWESRKEFCYQKCNLGVESSEGVSIYEFRRKDIESNLVQSYFL